MMTRLAITIVLTLAAAAHAIDEQHRQKAAEMSAKAIAYLRTQQHPERGGWAVNPEGNQYPAITGLVLIGMLMEPTIDGNDPAVAAGVRFIMSYQQPDGGFYDRILPNYNTAVCVSALSKLKTPESDAAVKQAVLFLRGLQYSEEASGELAQEVMRVGPDHAFYGGVGYGRHGRPDNSNLNMFLQAMHDAGVPSSDPAFQRALVFLSRTQMLDGVNDMPYADGSRQGGFIYSTSESKDLVGNGQSFAGTIEETLDDGTQVSRLRAYASMTYAGFKSMIYADLPRDDVRVRAAWDWIRANYTLEENPGLATDGLYYYFTTFARALDAWSGPGDSDFIDVTGGTGPQTGRGETTRRDWANDLIDRLAALQNEDGSFKTVDDRWMENNPVLTTAYGLIALGHAVR